VVEKLIISEQGREWELRIEKFPITIGRGANNTIVLADPKSSRQHCIIEETEQGVVVRDLGSRNGTSVNGRRVEVAPLKEGDIIGIGDTLIFFGRKTQVPEEEQRFVLAVVSGENEGREYPLSPLPVTIGRKSGNRVVLSDERVSGEHALITYEDGEYVLKDLDSRNGTYVEEQRIVREVLKHGKRFRISTTVFEFRDKTKPPVERKQEEVVEEKPAPAVGVKEEPELPPDEKVISLDAERVMKAKPSLLPTLMMGIMGVFIVVAVLYFAYVLVRTVVHKGMLPSPSGSLITKNWSFEEMAKKSPPGWRVKGENWSQDEAYSKSGKRSLHLDLSAQPSEDARSEVLYAHRITVVSKSSYLLQGWVRTEDVQACGLGVRYRSSSNPKFVKEEFSQLISGTEPRFSLVRGLFVPPPEADEMEVFCVSFGNRGACWFDDIEMVEREEEPRTSLQTERGYTLRYDSRAVIDVALKGELILQDGMLSLYRSDEQLSLLSSQKLCRVLDPPFMTSDGVRFKGDIRGKKAGEWYRFEQRMKRADDDILLLYSFPAQIPDNLVVCYSFKVPLRVVEEGVVLITPAGRKRVKQQFEEPSVNELIFRSGSDDVVLRFQPPFAVSATQKEGYFEVRCAVFAEDLKEKKFSVLFSPFSAARKRGALQQLEKVRALFAKNRFSEVLTLLQELAEEPILKEHRDEMERLEADVRKRTEEWLQTAEAMLAEVTAEPRLERLLAVKSLCKKIKEAYPSGYNFDKAQSILEKAEDSYKAFVERERVERVERLIQKAEKYRDDGLIGYAVAVYKFIKERYPDTLWAKKASSALQILAKKRRE